MLDSTKEFSLLLSEETAIVGLSSTVRTEAAARAKQAYPVKHADATAQSGPWLFALDAPSLTPVMKTCASRETRQALYEGKITRYAW